MDEGRSHLQPFSTADQQNIMHKMHRIDTFFAFFLEFRSYLYDFNGNANITLEVSKLLHEHKLIPTDKFNKC